MAPIYLDWNASAPTRPEVWDAVRAAADLVGNPASAHRAGREVRRRLDDARELVAGRLAAHPDEVVFTAGATEANNLAVFGLAGGPPGRLVAAPIEHPCVAEPISVLAKRGFAVDRLPVGERGHVEPTAVRERVTPDTRLVAVMLANHETGAVQPVRRIVGGLPSGVPVHCDAAQAVGKIPVSFRDLGVATLTASGHKFGGPPGVGVLLVRRDVTLAPLLVGGHQQRGRRPGTEPAALAVGFAVAVDLAARELDANRAKLEALRSRFLGELRAADIAFDINGPGPGDPDGLPNALNLSFTGCRADLLLVRLDLAGVACSAGAACASGSLLPSPVLTAMGLPDVRVRAAVRFSLGPSLAEEQVVDAARRVAGCVRAVRRV